MNSLSKHFIIPGLIVGFVPHAVAAEVSTISETIGLLNILTGFMFVAAITIFVGGIISYWIDFGNSERIKGIKLMEWGVAILFVLVVFLGVVQFFQGHQAATNIVVATIVIIGAVWVVLTVLLEPQKPEKEKKEGPPKP